MDNLVSGIVGIAFGVLLLSRLEDCTNTSYNDGLHRGRRECCQSRGGEYPHLNGEDICIPKGVRR